MEKLYTVRALAEVLSVTRAAVYKWMKDGKLEYVIVGSERRVPQSAVDAFIKHQGGSASPKAERRPLVAATPA